MQGVFATQVILPTCGQASTSGAGTAPWKAPITTSRHAFRGSPHLAATSVRSVSRRCARKSLQITRSILDVTEDTFEKEVLKAGVPVLVDFWATWCGPCKLIAPLLNVLEQEFGDSLKIVKVEADPCPNLMEQYKVYGLPTLMLFRDGKVVEGSLQEGAIDKKKLTAYLEKHGLAPAAK